MNVLMISIDKGLLGQGQLGDVCERHKKYGEFCEQLNIIVLNRKNHTFCHSDRSHDGAKWSQDGVGESAKEINLSDKVMVYPTNSYCKLFYYFDALKIGKKLFQESHSAGSGQTSYELIVCQDPFLTGLIGWKLKKKFGVKLLIHFHGDYKFPFWQVVKNADGVRVMSQGQKEKLIKKGVAENKIYMISTPVNLEKYQYPDLNQVKEFKKHGMPIILHVSRRDDVKDFKTLFETISLVLKKIKIHFWQVGASFTMTEIKKYLSAKVISLTGDAAFHLDPLVEANSLINIYHASDIIVLTSKSESFGKVLVEANACGKPVVATVTTGAKEIIQDGVNGFLVPIGDAQALAEKIIYLLDNPELARQMGENGRKLVMEKFNGARQLEKIKNMWQEIIK